MTFILVLFFIVCYVTGGQSNSWVRKYVMPLGFGGGLLVSWLIQGKLHWLSAFGAVLYFPLMSLFAYGETYTQNILWKKIIFRSLCGLMPGICAVVISLGAGTFPLGLIQLILGIWFSVIFGVFSPLPNYLGNDKTLFEDILISASYVFLIPFIL